jgi:flagellar biosynthesis/type III secretory pathway M-ring protein FliF/YscJ
MKPFEDDMELKKLLKSVKPGSTGTGFTADVMNRIFKEQAAFEQIKNEPLFGKGFWFIIALFVLLIAAMMIFSSYTPVTESGDTLLPALNFDFKIPEFPAVLSRLGVLPAGIAAILLSTSLLILIEKVFDSRVNVT